MIRLLPRRSNDVTYFTNDRRPRARGPARRGTRDGGCADAATRATRRTSTRVLTTSERSSILGYDIVVAAPRPISVLLAVDPEHARGRRRRRTARRCARRSTTSKSARSWCETDAGARTATRRAWSGIVGFTHGLNRHGEPHLHDHVLVGARPEGHRNVLDVARLYAHAAAADALYRASLRHELGERTAVVGVAIVRRRRARRRTRRGVPGALGWASRRSRREVCTGREGDARVVGATTANASSRWASCEAPERRRALDEHRFAGALEGRYDVARRHVIAAWATPRASGRSSTSSSRAVDALYPDAVAARGGVREPTIRFATRA